jgi:hypothetical protein
MKAYLLAHPTYLTGVSANDTLPSNSQGYGMPNMTAMFDDSAKFLLDQDVTFDNSGETWTWVGAVVDPAKPVRIVLAYTDAPGAIGTSPQVNDLNLAADVGGTAYLGNVFSGQWSVTGGSSDQFNNYEAVFLPTGTDGGIEITITGFNIAGDGVPNSGDSTDQDFALVCYNCAQTPTYTLSVTPASLLVCAPDDAIYSVDISQVLGYTDQVTLSAAGNPAGTSASFSANPVTPPGSSTLTIGSTGSAAAGSYNIDVSGSATAGIKTQTVSLDLFTGVPPGPGLLTPADGAMDAPFKPVFSWTAVPQASSYLLEVATDAGFTNIVYSASETGTSHKATVPLSAGTTYYWRVTAQNICGSGSSSTYSFTTQGASLVCNGSDVDFEDGIPADWTVVDNTGGVGIVWTTTADPACDKFNLTNGSGEAACADSDAAGYPAVPYDTELVTNPFDLTTVGAAFMDVKAYYNDISTGFNDRFEVDIWDGISWTNELSWDEDHTPEDFSLNLSVYAGLPTVQARFRYSGDGYDWYAQVDDVALTCVPASDPVIEVVPASIAAEQGPDIISSQLMHIYNSGGSPLNWNIGEDDTACDSPMDIPWLNVNPVAGTTIPLGGTDIDVNFNSAGLAPGDYTSNLCVNSDDPVTPLVQVPVSLTVLPPELLECNGEVIAFEDGIPLGWQVVDNTGGTGLVWTTTADPACGRGNLTNGSGEAACADSDEAGYPAVPYDTELRTPTFDLSTVGAATLDVKAYYNDISTGFNDRFEVDIWDGISWTNELSWDEDHMPEDFSLNLAAYAGLPTVQASFRYSGDGYDWYAQVDDIALTCVEVSPPDVVVSPSPITASQGPDTVTTEQMAITNNGGSPLNWTIVEDDNACGSPTDISWMSVSPDTGTTIPSGSTLIDVTFDSTGLTPGDYNANLCVNSDDPDTPVSQVPVILTVLPPFTLECNGDIAGFETGIPPGWQVIDNEGNGLVWTDIAGSGESGNYTGGAGDAATVSSDIFGPAGFDTELRTTSFDLSGWLSTDVITLNYLANYQNLAAFDFLTLDISTDDGVTWTSLLIWNEDHGGFRSPPGVSVSFDLTPFAGLNGLKLRWHYYDPTPGLDWDWYAQLDDIGLSCIPNPVIDVDPNSLSSNQVPGQDLTSPLTISNLGGADLNWSILEDVPASPIPTPPPVLIGSSEPMGPTDPDKLGIDNAAVYPRSALEDVNSGLTRYTPRPGALLLSEGFEDGVVPPVGWEHVANNPNETWKLHSGPHTGVFAADVVYDPALIPQDEWLLSPEMSLTEGTLSFWSFGSLYWCRDTFDNCDLNIWLVVGDIGGGDDIFVGKGDDAWAGSYTWSQSVFNLAPLLPWKPFRIGFQYAGLDGAQIALDDIVVDGTERTACLSPEDVSWLSVSPLAGTTVPGDSTSIDVTTDATGLTPGLYEADLCVSSNDPHNPLTVVPVDMTVEPLTISVTKSANVTSVDEPGGDVTFTIVVTNDSIVDVTIDTLVDSAFDLSVHCPDAVGTVVSPGESYTCTFTDFVAGNVNETHQNFADAAASDSHGNSDSGLSSVVEVGFNNVVPSISVSKDAPPYAYQGDEVVFTITVANNSVATDPVTIGSIVDDIYGDVTSVHDDIADTDCATGVVISAGDSYICSFTATVPGDLVGDQTDTVEVEGTDDEGTLTPAEDDATVTVLPPSAATDSSLCIFDRDPSTDDREFRLLFTPDMQNWPSFKLTATNPGQFYYNIFHIGEGPASYELTIPYPFVTQGAMPVHIYSDVHVTMNENGEPCFVSGGEATAIQELIEISDHIDTDGDGKPDAVVISLANIPVDGEFSYLNIHLDYGLKGGEDRYERAANPDGTTDAVDFETGEILIPDREQYLFSAAVNASPLDGDVLLNVNVFKRMAGVAGFVQDGEDNLIEGALVQLIIPEDVKFKAAFLEALSDEDGWYMIKYKHKGRPTEFPIELWIDGNLIMEGVVPLKGNAFAEMHFTLP